MVGTYGSDPGYIVQVLAEQLDHRYRTAQLVGNNGTADMMAVRGSGSMSFIEVTPGGWANLLTVYALRHVEGGFHAAYSRHPGFGGFPGANNDEGSCWARITVD